MMMPLLCFDLVEGRSERQLKMILDATHEVLVSAFNVPQRDRYQIVREHPPSRMIIEDTGLGIKRTPDMLVLQVTTRPRSRATKQAFYKSLVEKLEAVCGLAPSDVVVTFVTNTDEDWSFGLGRAQFLTGEL
ncbi:phenylpyruvate tautomerase PptA (4-oxalocrotonate tautomerase family) [Bradyrhizobium sp. USDA 4341]|jgi:hypothetical protein